MRDGWRLAARADRRDIVLLVLREGARVAGIGTVAGFLVAVFVLRVTAGMLPQLPTADAVSFVTVPVILAAMVVLACLVPALRAARVDPAAVLRT